MAPDFFTLLSLSLLEYSGVTYLAFVCIWFHCFHTRVEGLFNGLEPAGRLVEKVSESEESKTN